MQYLISVISTPGIAEFVFVLLSIFVLTILLGILIWSNWSWIVKAILTLLSGLFFCIIFFATLNMQGWPTNDQLPNEFEFISYYSDYPNPAINKKGFIVLWILNLGDELEKKPRAHIVPYDRELHIKLEAADGQKGIGKRIIGKAGRDKKSKKQHLSPDSTYPEDFEFYEMPMPELPSKQ